MDREQIRDLLERAVWTFAQAFLATLLVLAPGVLQAPNLSEARALAVAAVIGAVGAGLSALKTLIKETV